MPHNSETRRLLDIAEPVCHDAGYELLDLRLRRDQRGAVLQIFIDRLSDTAMAPGSGETKPIGFDDCERVSRELGTVFDVEDALDHQYSLEVSSPGMDRPLRTADHFERFAGADAKVTLHHGLDGRRRFAGTLRSVSRATDAPGDDAIFVHIDVDGTEYALPLADIESAQIVPNWDELLHKTAGAR